MDTLRQDIQYALRVLRRNRSTTLFAILALALGIGANSAIFSVFNAVLLRPLPYQDAEGLVLIYGRMTRDGQTERRSVSYPDFTDWRDRNRVFEKISAVAGPSFSLTGIDIPERVEGELVSASYFATLGVRPILGRTFLEEEDRTPDVHPVAMISEGFWQNYFGRNPNAVGRTLQLNGTAYTVVGVLPGAFRGITNDRSEVWLPMAMVSSVRNSAVLGERHQRWMSAVARLKPGLTITDAQAEINSISADLAATYPDSNQQRSAEVASPFEELVGPFRSALIVLLVAVGFVLLIACGNVANLLLARASARQKEIAVRTALGAGRGRIIRQLLTESVILALVAGGFGILSAVWGIDLLLSRNLISFPSFVNVELDARVLGFSLLLSVVTGVVFGILPALSAARPNLVPALKEGRGLHGGVKRTRWLSALVISEVTLSVVLLVGATLMIRTASQLHRVDPGFEADNMLTMRLSLPPSHSRQQAIDFSRRAIETITALPGVESATLASDLPLSGSTSAAGIVIEGQPRPEPGLEPRFFRHRVTPDFFKTLGIRLINGRAFSWNDTETSPKVVIVSETTARRFWPGEDAVGKRIEPEGSEEGWMTIVGVAADVKYRGFPINPDNHPDVYFSLEQYPDRNLMLAVRTKVDPAAITASLRRAITQIDPNLPAFSIATMQDMTQNQIANSNFTTLLLTIFSAVALVLAVIGVYGVMSYSVEQRRHEIGIRIALGAGRTDVYRLLIGRGMGLVAAGLALGIALALALARLMTDLLYGVGARDPITFAAVSIVMITVGILASYIPANRASRVDPMIAVRND